MQGDSSTWYASQCGDSSFHGNSFCCSAKVGTPAPAPADPALIGPGCCRPYSSLQTWSTSTTKGACAQQCASDASCGAFAVTGCSSSSDSNCGGSCFLYHMQGDSSTWYTSKCGDSSFHGNSFCYSAEVERSAGVWPEHSLVVNGDTRYYALHVPPGSEGDSSPVPTLPLVLVAPGSGGSRWQSPWEEIQTYARRGSYAVVLLEGKDLRFNVGGNNSKPDMPGGNDGVDDEQYVIDVVNSLTGFTRGNTFCTGYSRGARFCALLTSSQRLQAAGIYFSGYAAAGGLRFSYPMYGVSVPVMAAHTVGDPVNPYCGGTGGYWGMSVPDAVRAWSEWNQCQLPPSAGAPRGCADPCGQVEGRGGLPGAARFACGGCTSWHSPAGVEVVLDRLPGSAHEWPAGAIGAFFGFFDRYK